VLKRLVFASALSALAAGASLAKTPANFDECMEIINDLDRTLLKKTTSMLPEQIRQAGGADAFKQALANGTVKIGNDEVNDLMAQMDDQCEAKQYQQVLVLADKVKALLEKE
jgi:hypothetical protein